MARMVAVSEDPQIIAAREAINLLLGLPKHAIVTPPPEEPLIIATADGSGTAQLHLVTSFCWCDVKGLLLGCKTALVGVGDICAQLNTDRQFRVAFVLAFAAL